MAQTIKRYTTLARKCEIAIREALTHMYLEDVTDERAKFLLAISTQAGRSTGAVALLLQNGFYTQALTICRSMLEAVAFASFITSEENGFKLVEKQSLEKLRTLFEGAELEHNSAELKKLIREIHPDDTKRLRIENLLGRFERAVMPDSKGNLFYLGYRRLCGYTHPDLTTLSQAVEVDGRKLKIFPDKEAMKDEMSLGLGLAGAINTCLILNTEVGRVQFRPDTMTNLDQVLNEALDLVGEKENG